MFIKKWWLEHTFLVEGHRVQFRGWINTTAQRKEDFPDILHGTFWASKNPETDGDGMRGEFHLDDGSEGKYPYVFGSVYPVYLAEGIQLSGIRNRENAERIMQANEPMISYPRFEARIEGCIVPEGTYIAEY